MYLLSFICGIFTHKSIFSFFIVFFINFNLLLIEFSLLLAFFISGYFLYKILIPVSVFFATAYGIVEYKTKNHLFIDGIRSYSSMPNQLCLKYDNTDDINIGDKIKFNCVYFPNRKGKINKIHYNKNSEMTYLQKKRIEIKELCEKSKFSSFLKAISIGDRSEFSNDDIIKLKNSNFWHLIAISGLHMNIIMFYIFYLLHNTFNLSFLLNYKYNSRKLASIISIIIGFLYVKISLYSIPAIRSFIMASISLFFGGSLNNKKVLLLTAFLMITVNPAVVFDMGFQLSFICTWILINKHSTFLLNLAIMPILQQFNLVCLITNFLVLPLFSCVLISLLIAILLKSIMILHITDFFCFLMFKIIYLPTIIIKCSFNDIAQILYWIAFNLFIILNKKIYIISIFLIILISNLFI